MPSPTTAPTVAPPVRLEPAYADRSSVWNLVTSHSPYPLMAGSEGYRELMQTQNLSPFFRSVWAHDGIPLSKDLAPLLHHERFIEGARELFGAQVVRPANLIVNVMGPGNDLGRHVDTPTFRGLKREDSPIWLLVVMGMSGLFERWAVRVAGALTWFYENTDGEFEYWPDGVEAPSLVESAPFGNVAIVADNDLMTHRVGRIGAPEHFKREVQLTLNSTIHACANGGWEIRDGDTLLGSLGPTEVRVSLLWKALTFVDERAAQVYDDHEDDLNLEAIAALFRADLAGRGLEAPATDDLLSEPSWAKTLTSTYMGRGNG